MAKMGGKSWLLPQFLTNSHGQMFALGCRCARLFFDSGRKCVAMVTAYYGKNGGKIVANYFLIVGNSHFGTDVCLGVLDSNFLTVGGVTTELWIGLNDFLSFSTDPDVVSMGGQHSHVDIHTVEYWSRA